MISRFDAYNSWIENCLCDYCCCSEEFIESISNDTVVIISCGTDDLLHIMCTIIVTNGLFMSLHHNREWKLNKRNDVSLERTWINPKVQLGTKDAQL